MPKAAKTKKLVSVLTTFVSMTSANSKAEEI